MCLCAYQDEIAVERSEVQKGETRCLGEDGVVSFFSSSLFLLQPLTRHIPHHSFIILTTAHQSILPTSRIDVAFSFFFITR